MHNPEWAGIEFSLPSGSAESFQLFQSWLSSVGELMVVGLDARYIDHRMMEHIASITASERWRLKYEVISINAEAVNFSV